MDENREKRMRANSVWEFYPRTYRQREIQTLARWIAAGHSGSVLGLPGCGRSNLLGFLCHRPDAFALYWPESPAPTVIPVDLHPLPSSDLATFYKVVLRAFYRASGHFDGVLQEQSQQLYQEHLRESDPFLLQSALYDLLATFQKSGSRVTLVLNYFHFFLQEATPKMVSSLRALRDGFKATLNFIVGMTQALAYQPEPDLLGEMYDLLDRNVCWVGAMTDADAQNLIERALRTISPRPSVREVAAISRLSGNFPVLLKLIALWWANTANRPPMDQWLNLFVHTDRVQHRLEKLWNGLTQEEQFLVAAITTNTPRLADERHQPLLFSLAKKGVCQQMDTGWAIRGELLAAYVNDVGAASRGRIWMEAETLQIYQGITPVADLAPLEMRLLQYLIKNPHKPHTKDVLIGHVWEDKGEIMLDNDLQQLVYRLRKKLDTNPPQYIVTWKGRPGGYQFYPEGRPR